MWRECAPVGHPGLCASGQICLFPRASLGQPGPRQKAAATAPCRVEACLFSSWGDGDLPERASHEECGESSCPRGRHAPRYWQGLEHGKRELRCLIAEGDPGLPPALKPGAPFCRRGPACEGFLGCGCGLLRAAVFCRAWTRLSN